MKPGIKEKWLSALRSGEYQQTKHVLKDVFGFCCLGVLCDIYSKETDTPWSYINSNRGEKEVLPLYVQLWAGLESKNPVVGPIRTTLSELNDNGVIFSDIADIIEKQL